MKHMRYFIKIIIRSYPMKRKERSMMNFANMANNPKIISKTQNKIIHLPMSNSERGDRTLIITINQRHHVKYHHLI